MSSSKNDNPQNPPEEDLDDLLDADDAAEEVEEGDDLAMDSDNDEELILQNDSIAFFDLPQDSLFAIAQHPVHPSLVAVGGSAGQEDDAPGAGWLFDTSAAASRPVLPASFANDPSNQPQTTQLDSLFALDGHTDSINTLCWTLPHGEFLVSGGLDGRLRAWRADVRPGAGVNMTFLAEALEVPEVNWVSPCPSPTTPNTIALGASDGSVWIYNIDLTDLANPLQIVQSYFLHTMASTAGAWTPDGQLLATISEDGSLYVWDVWGQAASKGVASDNGMTVVSLTGEDQRFEVEGGLYSLAIDPKGGFVAVGGAGGAIKIVSLPRLSAATQSQSQARGGGRSAAAKSAADPTTGGQILASLHNQSDSVESLALTTTSTSPSTTLLAAGSVDGSICIYDVTRRFAVRRHIAGAHEEHSVVKLEFIKSSWLLTSCGMDGVVRRWDLRGGSAAGPNAATSAADAGLVKEWKGHRGDGEGGGVLGFVQGETGERIVTAGDDGVSLVFEA
ncbi:ribosome biogenesis protein Sqt1 [Paramyrothecium foliicola]|nr:ribosome biogenesis protein Sqt1 [Paramyrothecium foliicola]